MGSTASFQVVMSAISHTGDIVVTQINYPDEPTFILALINLHQRAAYNDPAMFLICWLLSIIQRSRRLVGVGERNANAASREFQSFRVRSKQIEGLHT